MQPPPASAVPAPALTTPALSEAEGRRALGVARPPAGALAETADGRHFDPAAVWERLLPEFAGRLGRSTVRRTVRDCAADISAVPVPALPELVERSARYRLTVLLDHHRTTRAGA